MKYKLTLSDNSFFIVNENTIITVFKCFKKYKLAIKDILDTYENYYLLDKINNKKIKRKFNIEETDLNLSENIRFKFSQDIEIGDLVISPDGTPTQVKELHTGISDMYEITINDKTYTVNGDHILHLVDKISGEEIDLPVNVYIYMDDEFKNNCLMLQGDQL